MKRLCIIGFLICAVCLSGCTITKLEAHDHASDTAPTAQTSAITGAADIELGDTHFATHVSEIATDPEAYLGMTVRLQGYVERYADDPDIQFAVLRDFDDGESVTPWGFDCYYALSTPENGEWVEVIGELEGYTVETGESYLRLFVTTLTRIPEADRPSRLVTD